MTRTFRGGALVFASIVAAGCGSNAPELARLRAENAQLAAQIKELTAELEELKYGADRLLSKAREELAEENLEAAKATLEELLERHPGSTQSTEAKSLLADVQARIETAEKKRKEEERLALARATRNMNRSTDEITGITWIRHKNSPDATSHALLYFGTENGSAAKYPIRLRIQYYGSNWRFARSLTIKADDEIFELPDLDFRRDNGYGHVWEWIDVPVLNYTSPVKHSMLKKILEADRVVIRFQGDPYHHDFVLPKNQQAMMRDVYAAWQALGGKQS